MEEVEASTALALAFLQIDTEKANLFFVLELVVEAKFATTTE